MKKIFLFLGLLFLNRLTWAQSETVLFSSNAFYSTTIDSISASIVPSTTVIFFTRDQITSATAKVGEITYSNISSSMTIFFSTSPTTLWNIQNGTPLFPQSQVTLDWNPRMNFSSNTASRFYWSADQGGSGVSSTTVKAWIRYVE